MIHFVKKLQKRFDEMCVTGKLFISELSGSKLWEIYLSNFPTDQDPVFRDPNSTTHNCNLCNHFIRRYGNIVAIDPKTFELMSIWDVYEEVSEEYKSSCEEMYKAIHNSPIATSFVLTFNELNDLPYEKITKQQSTFQLGMAYNVKRYTKEEAELYGVVKPDEIRRFNHFNLSLKKEFLTIDSVKSAATLQSEVRSNKQVFQRGMEEIPLDTLILVQDLINQNSLLNGEAHLHKIQEFIKFKTVYTKLNSKIVDNWFWYTSINLPIAKFRNELIGVLCVELAEGKDLNKACRDWNFRVDPVNYMKASAPITKAQIQAAETFLTDNGYVESFDRRHATFRDIKASEIKHMNAGSGQIKSVSIFDDMKQTVSTRHKRSEFDKVEEIPVEQFFEKILPTATSVEVLFTNEHINNLVSLTTSKHQNSKPIFKWNNNYSWTFKGGLAGKSEIKTAVKSRGGDVNGVLRFSIMWSSPESRDDSDLDAWCEEPGKTYVGYSSGYRKDQRGERSPNSGILDVDIIFPGQYDYTNIVENITYNDLNKMKPGTYLFYVNPYSVRGSRGFSAEIEMDGELFQYQYNQPVQKAIQVAKVHLSADKQFSIEHLLPETTMDQNVYGIRTNSFYKTNLICLSPNYWDDQKIGNKHYFFMLPDCKVDVPIRGFHNENFLSELQVHRKVLDVLGAIKMIEPSDEQLSGLGFNATVRDSLIVRLQGSFKRVVKIIF